MPAEGTTADAAVHTEGATITADGDTLSSVTLSAYEVTKLVTISKSVEKMAIDAFESWLVNKIARKIAEKIGKLIIFGTGTNEAQGINVITWSATNSVTVGKPPLFLPQTCRVPLRCLTAAMTTARSGLCRNRLSLPTFTRL